MRTAYLKSGIIAALICAQTVLTLTAWLALNDYRNDRGIPRGIKINGVPVGGFTRQQTEKLLRETFNNGLEVPLVIQAGEKNISVRPESVDAELNYDHAIEEALDLKKQATGLTGKLTELALLAGLHDIPLTFQFNHDKMADRLEELKSSVDVIPLSATLIGNENERMLVPEKNGQFLNIPATMRQIDAITPPLPDSIQAIIVPKKAPAAAKDLEPLRNILGECETELNPTQTDRTANITLAVNALHNTLVKPDEIFSFNERIGERSAENGFKNAPVIDGSKTITGLGGGVCQVSTTLYNALLTANLEIMERQPHTRPVGYVPPGLDATVVDGQIDLRFRNNRDYPVFVTGTLMNRKLQVKIWGVMNDNEPRIDIDTNIQIVTPETLIHQEPGLPQGTQVLQSPGRRGYVAFVYKVIKGPLGETRQLITRDYYPPESKVILVGTEGSNPSK
ncbi:VanW family protein [Desulfoscipio gibsoniae]